MKMQVLDKNGNRRATCKTKEEAESVVERMEIERPAFGPFDIVAIKTGKGEPK